MTARWSGLHPVLRCYILSTAVAGGIFATLAVAPLVSLRLAAGTGVLLFVVSHLMFRWMLDPAFLNGAAHDDPLTPADRELLRAPVVPQALLKTWERDTVAVSPGALAALLGDDTSVLDSRDLGYTGERRSGGAR